MLEIFDTHAHYHAEQFDGDRDAVLAAMHAGFDKPLKEKPEELPKEHAAEGGERNGGTAECGERNGGAAEGEKRNGGAAESEKRNIDSVESGREPEYRIRTIVDIAAERDSLDKVMDLTRRYDFIYGAIGLHPDEIADLTPETEAYMERLLEEPKIVAVGEIGIDYYWNKEARDVQIAGFRRQIDMAVRHGLPIIVHSREAAEDTMNTVKAHAQAIEAAVRARRGLQHAACPGIIHCYSYSAEHARMYADMGFMLGIGGVVTYKNAKKLKEVVRAVPLENLVLETDCPYLSPTPFRGKRNDSRMLAYVAEEIASIRGISVREVTEQTMRNARDLFEI